MQKYTIDNYCHVKIIDIFITMKKFFLGGEWELSDEQQECLMVEQ